MECRLQVARADSADAPLLPPEYFRLNSEPKHAKANKVEFGKRKALHASIRRSSTTCLILVTKIF